jgi:hypothetical protein
MRPEKNNPLAVLRKGCIKMKWIAVLLLISLSSSIASADVLAVTPLTRNQAIFMEGPSAGTFEPFVQQYWSTYQAKTLNVTPPTTVSSPNNTMGIWFNQFPILDFEAPVKLSKTSFSSGGHGASKIDPVVWRSLMLERETTYKFGQDMSFALAPPETSFAMVDGQVAAAPSKSKGLILSQGISSLFNT